MSAPDTCPQCGAGLAASDHAAAYRCGTLVSSSGRFYHTGVCRSFAELRKPLDAERDQLATELQTLRTANAALVERVKRLEAAGDDVLNAAWDVQCWKGTRLGDCLDQWEAAKGHP